MSEYDKEDIKEMAKQGQQIESNKEKIDQLFKMISEMRQEFRDDLSEMRQDFKGDIADLKDHLSNGWKSDFIEKLTEELINEGEEERNLVLKQQQNELESEKNELEDKKIDLKNKKLWLGFFSGTGLTVIIEIIKRIN